MDLEQIREYCLAKQGASEHFPFDENTLVIKSLNKMFALLPLNTPEWITLKCEPNRSLELRDQYADIQAAYHFNKKHWNQLRFGKLPSRLVAELINHSYDEVVKKMTSKERMSLRQIPLP